MPTTNQQCLNLIVGIITILTAIVKTTYCLTRNKQSSTTGEATSSHLSRCNCHRCFICNACSHLLGVHFCPKVKKLCRQGLTRFTAHGTLVQSNGEPLPSARGIDSGVAALLWSMCPQLPEALKTFSTCCMMAMICEILTLPSSIKMSTSWMTEIQPFSTSRTSRQMPPSTLANISQHPLWCFAQLLLQISSLSLCDSRPTLAPTISTSNFTWEQPSCNACLTLPPPPLPSSEWEEIPEALQSDVTWQPGMVISFGLFSRPDGTISYTCVYCSHCANSSIPSIKPVTSESSISNPRTASTTFTSFCNDAPPEDHVANSDTGC